MTSIGYRLAFRRPHRRRDEFWNRVAKGPGCWEWEGSLNAYGYGVLARFENKTKYVLMAHRVAYELLVGPIPDGLQIDHLCRNPRCVRPDHLEPVTNAVNQARAAAVRTTCPYGHSYTGRRNNRGERVCVECIRIKNARDYEIESQRLRRQPHNRTKTHCLRGHPLDGPDIYIDKRGRRQCRACERIRHRERVA